MPSENTLPQQPPTFLRGTDQEFLDGLREALGTQDNRATAHPVFILQEKRKRYGIDPGVADPDGWTLVDDDTQDRAEGGQGQDPGEPPEGWYYTLPPDGLADEYRLVNTGGEPVGRRTFKDSLPEGWEWRPFVNEWVDVQGVFAFSEAGIEDHLRQNRHDYGEIRTWVASMYQCDEMSRLRELLISGLLGPESRGDRLAKDAAAWGPTALAKLQEEYKLTYVHPAKVGQEAAAMAHGARGYFGDDS
jgi:hypothetical protein